MEDENGEELPLGDLIREFLGDHKEAIDDILRDWGKGARRHGYIVAGILAFLGGIVILTGLLTLWGVLPGEAFAFLVGTILMYLFNMIGPRFQVS